MSDLDFDFSTIVQHAKDIVIVTKAHPINDPGPEIVYVNEAFIEKTGYTAEEGYWQNTQNSTKRGNRQRRLE
jgi:PAS domain-containing protein